VIKIVSRLQPDVMVVRHPSLNVLGTKMGIPNIMEGDVNNTVGYEGLLNFGRRLRQVLRTKKYYDNVAAHVELPYSEWWLDQQNPFYFD
jgi:nitrogenase molybdenum-iron protein alpha chain